MTIAGDDAKSGLSITSISTMALKNVSRKFWSVFGAAHHQYSTHFLTETPGELDDLRTSYIETDKVKPLIDTVFDWRTEGVEALYLFYEKCQSGKAQGKLVLKIAEED